MIPESLHLRNFLSHRETDLDLRGVHLASLVGQNGAGKSALLDAMTWAVWGRSRAPYGRDDDLVYHGESDLEVEYVFRMPYQSGQEQRCRILRRREQRGRRSISSLLDFEVETEQGWRVLTSDSIRETQQRIIEHLGLDYDTFINSAYLRQGHADEFTIQTAAQRKQVLSTILGLDRWGTYQERARSKLSTTQGSMRELDRRLDEIEAEIARRSEYEAALELAESEASSAEAALGQAQIAVDKLHRFREQAMAVQNRVQDLRRREQETRAEQVQVQASIAQREERLTYYQSLVDQAAVIEARYHEYQECLAAERVLGQQLGQAAQLQEQRARLESEITGERETLYGKLRMLEAEETRLNQAIQEERAQLTYELGDLKTQETLLAERFPTARLRNDLQHAQVALNELEKVEQSQNEIQQRIQDIEIERSRLEERNRQLREQMDETKVRLNTLAAATANCPLCRQPLSPEHQARLLSEIGEQGNAMGDEFRANRQRIAEIQQTYEELNIKVKVLERQLRGRPAREQAVARLQQQLEQGEEAIARSAVLQEQISIWTEKIATRDYAHIDHNALDVIMQQKTDLELQLASESYVQEARKRLEAVTQDLTALGYDATAHQALQQQIQQMGKVETEYRELEKARVGVAGERQILKNLTNQISALNARAQQITDEILVQEDVLDKLKPCLSEAPNLSQRLNEARQQAVVARQRVGAARQNLAALTTLEQRLASLREDRTGLARDIAIYTELREAFGVNGIPAMIIEHTLPELERDANHILQQLTGGRMHIRFETQRETKAGDLRETLDIIISDEKGTRPYESFSGGEQFRINFAIRVALSRMLAQRSGVRLRSLFVDEGFGALDADGRQRLVEAVKAVQDEFDMVLVITHVDELREAFPTQILVTKTESGSQIEIV